MIYRIFTLAGLLLSASASAATPSTQPAAGTLQAIVTDSSAKSTTQSSTAMTVDEGEVLRAISNAEAIAAADPFHQNQKEKATWLGVATVRPPRPMMTQLKINSGLLVYQVAPKSPAESAGLKADDIIQKLDDQLVVNPEQIAELIRLHKPGDHVTLLVMHEGSPTTLNATLIEHEASPIPDVSNVFVTRGQPVTVRIQPSGTYDAKIDSFNNDGKQYKMPGADGSPTVLKNLKSIYTNDNHVFILQQDDDHKTLTITGKDKKRLFAGPIDTAEQRAQIPADLQEEFKAMQKMVEQTNQK